jgi:predicted nicotinamide N-methyase
MNYAHKLVAIEAGLTLHVPDNELVKSRYEVLLANNAATLFPFWAKIWPASTAMTTFLQTETSYIKGKRVLEIGAGIGLPSFAIAKHSSEIIISDYATDAITLIEKNILHLGLTNAKAMCLDWNNFPGNIKADVILLSDINYAPTDFNSLQILIKQFLAQGSTIIIATPHRITASPFVEKLAQYIKRSELQQIGNEFELIDIRILILSL